MAEIEDTIADFARVYRRHSELPPIDGARAQLKTAELAGKLRADSWPGFFRFAPAARIARIFASPSSLLSCSAGFSSNTRR
jgi:hypothetical protein